MRGLGRSTCSHLVGGRTDRILQATQCEKQAKSGKFVSVHGMTVGLQTAVTAEL